MSEIASHKMGRESATDRSGKSLISRMCKELLRISKGKKKQKQESPTEMGKIFEQTFHKREYPSGQ